MVFGDSRPIVALWLFLVLLLFNQLLLGIITPGWLDLVAKLTPVNRRGRLVGIRNAAGGVIGFGCGAVLTWLLTAWSFPASYALAFFCAFSLQLASVVVQLQLVEPEPSAVAEPGSMIVFWKHLSRVFAEDKAFREFIFSLVFLTIAVMPVGFFTVYALSRFEMDESLVGEFTITLVAAQVASALLNGVLADRYGNKITLSVAAGGLLCASLTALLSPTLAWFRLVFVFLGVHLGSELMSRYNMSIEYGPPEQRSIYLGMMNTFLAPLYLSGMAGGWISDRFGYPAVFAVGAAFSLIGISFLILRVRDPRAMKVHL
jgi:MFS family permease